MNVEQLNKEIDDLQESILKCDPDKLEDIYESFGNTTVIYSNGEEKVLEPHYWVCFGKQILKNLKVEVKRDGGN